MLKRFQSDISDKLLKHFHGVKVTVYSRSHTYYKGEDCKRYKIIINKNTTLFTLGSLVFKHSSIEIL